MTPGQRMKHGHAPAAFPVRVLLAAERRSRAVRPGVVLGTVVGRVHDDRVVGDPQLVELVEHHADLLVVHDHAVAVRDPGRSCRCSSRQRACGSASPSSCTKGRTAGRPWPVSPSSRARRGDLLVDRLHALFGQRPGVFDLLFADAAPARVDCRVVLVGRPTMQHAARTEHLLELRILRDSRAVPVLLRR